MVCKSCGRLTDLRADDDAVDAVKECVCAAFKIQTADVELAPILLEGDCDQCKKAKKRKS